MARRRGTPEELREAVDAAVEQLAQAVDELRAIITDLRPAALDEIGVEAAIEAFAERVRNAPDAPVVHLVIDLGSGQGRSATRRPAAMESTLYRLVQEATTNAIKHAHATELDVAVVERGGVIEATVRDNGHGFDPEEATEGFGLIGMRERVALLGGTLQVQSSPGAGTVVRASVPAASGRDAAAG
jgi:signal transduction histidine kinase